MFVDSMAEGMKGHMICSQCGYQGRQKGEAVKLKSEIAARMERCGLVLHPAKTKIVYCKDASRVDDYESIALTF